MAEQIQIADGVQYFMLDAFILIAQAVFIQNPVIIDHHRVIQAAAQGKVLLAQQFDIAHKAEGARAADLFHERGG